jgi:hypothetical protein
MQQSYKINSILQPLKGSICDCKCKHKGKRNGGIHNKNKSLNLTNLIYVVLGLHEWAPSTLMYH